jgi:pilus assembly protein CpaB
MKPARIILLVVALVAGGLAAFLVTRGGAPVTTTEVVTQVVQEEKTQVLVAKTPIGMGERLSAATVEWQEWPQGALRSDYVTIAAMPDAAADLTGAVARYEFFPGEPIREAKLVRSDQGYLSAVLSEGMRGVSVGVSAVSSAGGFIVPNDHVDVILTSQSNVGERSEVVLANVRILAIGKRLGQVGASGGQTEQDVAAGATPAAMTFNDSTIATLELDPAQAETLINAATRGALSLTLRSVADFAADTTIAQRTNSSQTVRVFRFGREESVLSGKPGQTESMTPASPAAAVTPVAATSSATTSQLPAVSAPASDPALAAQNSNVPM